MEFQFALVVWKEEQQRTSIIPRKWIREPAEINSIPCECACQWGSGKKRYPATLLAVSGMLLHMHVAP